MPHSIRDKFPDMAPPGSMHTDPLDQQVIYELGEKVAELRRSYAGQPEKLALLSEIEARFTTSENDSLDNALLLVRALRGEMLSPDSLLPECTQDKLNAVAHRVRKRIVAEGGDSVLVPSRTQLLPTIESLLAALQG